MSLVVRDDTGRAVGMLSPAIWYSSPAIRYREVKFRYTWCITSYPISWGEIPRYICGQPELYGPWNKMVQVSFPATDNRHQVLLITDNRYHVYPGRRFRRRWPRRALRVAATAMSSGIDIVCMHRCIYVVSWHSCRRTSWIYISIYIYR